MSNRKPSEKPGENRAKEFLGELPHDYDTLMKHLPTVVFALDAQHKGKQFYRLTPKQVLMAERFAQVEALLGNLLEAKKLFREIRNNLHFIEYLNRDLDILGGASDDH